MAAAIDQFLHEQNMSRQDRQGWMPMRPRTLANSAIEFMETRPDQAFGSEVAEMIQPEAPQYAPELDQFVAPSNFPRQDYFKESEKHKEKFKATLSNFCKTVTKRDLGRQLSIEIKEPENYTMQDVVQVAQALQSKHEGTESGSGCLDKIRKCFRKACKNQGPLNNLLSFIPNDSYGAIICGGFTVILAAMDRAGSIQDQAYSVLESIPARLETIKELMQVHIQSVKLRLCADAVFIAIFSVLESLVDELSKNMFKKGVSLIVKGDGYGAKLQNSIDELEKAVTAFGEEARLCDSKRLASTHELSTSINVTVKDIAAEFDDFRRRSDRTALYFKEKLESLESQGRQTEQYRRLQQEYSEEKAQSLSVIVCNDLYEFFASSSSFDARKGTMSRQLDSVDQRRPYSNPSKLLAGSPSDTMQSRTLLSNRNRSIVSKWARRLNLSDQQDFKDIKEYTNDLPTLNLKEKDKFQFILESQEIKGWLTCSKSRVLGVDAETPPDDVLNHISCVSAFLANSLSSTAGFIVLSYMCALRRRNDSSGPAVMVQNLVAQLLMYIVENELDVDISFLADKEYRRKARKTLTGSVSLLGRLLGRLPAGETVFIILDAVSGLSGTMKEGAEAITELLEAVESSGAVVKVLVTITSAPMIVEIERRKQWHLLYVPDYVDGRKQDLNLEVLVRDTSLVIEDFRSSQQSSGRRDSSPLEFSLDDSSDDE